MSDASIDSPELPTGILPGRQKLVFCTYPSVYSDIVLDELLRSDVIDVVGVVVSTRVLRKNYNYLLASIRQIQQSGLRYATYLFIITSVYVGLQRILRKPTLHQHLRHMGIPLLETQDINDLAGVDFVLSLQTDVLLSAHFNQLVKAPLLESDSMRCLNIHPSLLPAYQGVDPAFYAMLRREQVTGVTVHVQDQEFDSGEILQQQPLKVRWHDSLLSLNMKLFKLGAISAVQQITGSGFEDEAEPEVAGLAAGDEVGAGNYDSWPNPYEAKQFRQQRKFLRWKELLRFIRRPKLRPT